MASKPVILTVDDDPAVLSAIHRDLRRTYGEHFRIVRAESGAEALDALRELKARAEAVALVLADQRMPHLTGVEVLAETLNLFPDAKRALLTAYADTEAAIRAINTAAVHHYLLKPWDPPEEKLYPVLDDLLDDWRASFRPPFEGVRILGHRWSAAGHALRDFLARNQIPYQHLDIELQPEAAALRGQLGLEGLELPIVLLPSGEALPAPSPAQLAEKLGLKTRPLRQFYDLAIIGAGPAGLAAAVYGASEGLNTVLVEREAPGGQAGTSSRIENYLGFPTGLSGGDLARRAADQARRFGVEILAPQEATGLKIDGPYRVVQLKDGAEIACHALVIASGLRYAKLDVPGMAPLLGVGVYYGASLTEATTCAGQTVVIVGAGNSAGQAAVYLAKHAARVVLVVRGKDLGAKMSHYLVERIEQTANIEVRLESEVIAVTGSARLETVTICHAPSRQEDHLTAAGLFVFIGAVPSTDWVEGAVARDSRGFILTGTALKAGGKPGYGWPLARDPYLLEASVPGVFVVGDVRSDSVKRVASAVGEGSIAVQFVHQYLAEGK